MNKPVTQNKSYTVTVSSHGVLEIIALHTYSCSKSFTPVVRPNSRIDNVLVKIAPDPSQPMSQFINAVDVCLINTCLRVLFNVHIWYELGWGLGCSKATNPAKWSMASFYTAVWQIHKRDVQCTILKNINGINVQWHQVDVISQRRSIRIGKIIRITITPFSLRESVE